MNALPAIGFDDPATTEMQIVSPFRADHIMNGAIGTRVPLRHPVTIPAGWWRVTVVDHGDGTADLELELLSMKGVPRMASEPLTAYHLANIIAGYLDDRDDIAAALVNPSEDVEQAVIEVTSQGGARFVVPVVGLREGG